MLKVNEYFDGNVKSIGFEQKGEKSTVGVMEAGEYLFNTAAPERMTVIKGALTIQLADEIAVIAGGRIAHRGTTEEILPLILADTLGGCPVLNREEARS